VIRIVMDDIYRETKHGVKGPNSRLMAADMLTYANHLRLFAEEIGTTGEQLGNFPQAFTHLALIDSAITLNALLDQRQAT
jgi:GH15 family glucan-1,4-alpha-glucosidase